MARDMEMVPDFIEITSAISTISSFDFLRLFHENFCEPKEK